jgi:hypothetical protein
MGNVCAPGGAPRRGLCRGSPQARRVNHSAASRAGRRAASERRERRPADRQTRKNGALVPRHMDGGAALARARCAGRRMPRLFSACPAPKISVAPNRCAPLIRCEFYALNGPKGSLVGRRATADHGAHGPYMNPATSPLKSRRRTLQGVLRERLQQIEATLRAGYRMRTIVEQLAQEGFQTTLGAFRDGLYRARLWRKTYGPLDLPPGDPPPVTPGRHVEGPPPQALPRLGPAPRALTPEDLKKRPGFQYEGTANLRKDDLV